AGLAGMIIIKDTIEAQLNLPRTYGVDDFPVILQDRRYSASGQFIVTALGDSMLVNGTPRPYLDCPQQVVRLRVLNASNARVYNLGFSDNRNFYVIASDASLLSQPYLTNRLMLGNGERVEILVDMTTDLVGSNVVLMSYGASLPTDVPGAITGMLGGNGPLEAADFGILQLNVQPQTASPVLSIPSALMTATPWNSANANRTRNKSISGMGNVNATMGNFFMDNTTFNMNVVNDTMLLNDIEVWNITSTANIAHPVHIHDISFYILERNGNAPPAYEGGLKDVFFIRPNETLKIIMKFEDYANDTMPFMTHCHNLAHEDMGMMTQFIVINSITAVPEIVYNENEISVYPNPFITSTTISVSPEIKNNFTEWNFELYDLSGRKVFEIKNITTSQIQLERENLSGGIYFYKITTKEKIIATGKMCIE
ncbi:MAG: multicopper oxidase domain-containing protein, partial [Bacteroidota bacterium]|nr:multicopper oxidase domain-containing protein [Bacteroidota bacterium]